jgi:type II secretory pathway component PulK
MDELDIEASRFTHGGEPIRAAQDRADSVTAEKIVEYRTAYGAFRSVDELDEVPGIGPSRVEQLRGLVIP